MSAQKMFQRFLLVLLPLTLLLGSTSAFAGYHKNPGKSVTLINAKGQNTGTATIKESKEGGVNIHLVVSGLTPGEHAVHFHQTPSCTAPDFKSAGGHFNPTAAHHGMDNRPARTPVTCPTSPSQPTVPLMSWSPTPASRSSRAHPTLFSPTAERRS